MNFEQNFCLYGIIFGQNLGSGKIRYVDLYHHFEEQNGGTNLIFRIYHRLARTISGLEACLHR